MKNAMRWMGLGLVLLGVLGAGTSPARAQEKNWAVELGVDYSTLYMFRGINLLGEDQEVLTPRVVATFGNFSAYYYGYMGNFDAFDADGNPAGEGDYGETDFGLDYTFSFGEKFSLTVGGVGYWYDGETESGLGFADTWELYGIASWDVVLAPTISYYQDMDAVEGGFLTLDLSHEMALTDSVALNLMGQIGFDFGYNQPGDSSAGIDQSSFDPNHWMLGADFALQLTDQFSMHAMVQQFWALDIAKDVGQDDETVITAGATYSF
jgi:hypothetical protein